MTHKIQQLLASGNEPTIKIVEMPSEEHALEAETLLISMIGRRDLKTGTLLNMTDGGEGISGYKHTSDTKHRMAETRTGMRHDEATKAKMRASCHISDEQKRLSSIANKGKTISAAQRELLRQANLGKKLSEATLAKLRGPRGPTVRTKQKLS